jgi:hypothetical protein
MPTNNTREILPHRTLSDLQPSSGLSLLFVSHNMIPGGVFAACGSFSSKLSKFTGVLEPNKV